VESKVELSRRRLVFGRESRLAFLQLTDVTAVTAGRERYALQKVQQKADMTTDIRSYIAEMQ